MEINIAFKHIFRQYLALALSLTVIAVVAAPSKVFALNEEADPVILTGNFFIVIESSDPFEPHEYDEKKVMKELLEEARWVFSAMIYGFEFSYTPYDAARKVSEEFSLELRHEVKWGDPSLKFDGGQYKDGIYYADISYHLKPEQAVWLTRWDSNIFPSIMSMGEGSLYSGLDGKLSAVTDSVKEAIRDYLRPRMFNKPRRVQGKAKLSSVPVFSMSEGTYKAKTKTLLQLDKISKYDLF